MPPSKKLSRLVGPAEKRRSVRQLVACQQPFGKKTSYPRFFGWPAFNMAKTDKRAHDSKHDAAVGASRIERVPRLGRYLLLVLGSLFLSSTLLTISTPQTAGHLAGVSKHLEEWWEVGGLIAWRALELGLVWVFGFDGWDVTELTVLTHVPTYFLLLNFYEVKPSAVAITFLIDVVSKTIPFIALRGPNSVHKLSSPRAEEVSNIGILQDWFTTVYTSVAAAAIYTIFLYLSFYTWLPVHLVTYFDGVSDIRLVHAGPAGLPSVFLSLVLGGYAAYDLLFVSSAGCSAKDSSQKSEDREGEYLITSLCNRTWGRFSPKGKVLASRTIILATMTLLNTVIQVSGTVRGVDVKGSAGWGALWATAALVVGGTFAWIEAVPGV
ncbi:hypothetical protein BGW36DRAFT_385016 [Talaromyces proteolyticus]|uniref:Uncharacterized protein n=1 Tax=Talaromyces proteolyticus TaxID=1131652 RepID=A0AAD4KPK5_9EURO|nr:uncharacterized protein BGW36DRAFT_385016 [Talaromyces proteolyticus]KAH8692709.1 hypothetical protein BGW36DRAFT_385016 [Talaromyces proteolyticus]